MQLKSSFNLAAYQNNQLYMWLVFGLDPDSVGLAASFFPHNTRRMWPNHKNTKHHSDGERAVGSAWCTTFSQYNVYNHNQKSFNLHTFVIPAPGLA